MSFIADKIVMDGLTYDDVLLIPAYSEVLPRTVELSTKFSKNIELKIPFVTAAMDTVTEAKMAIAIAREGGIGVIHKNMSIKEQAKQVATVKRAENGMIYDPVTIKKGSTVRDALALMAEYKIGGIPVVDDNRYLVGIVTNRDLRFERDMNKRIDEVMTKDNLVTTNQSTDLEAAAQILQKHKIEKLPVVDKDNKLIGLVTYKDITKAKDKPMACKDSKGRLRVAAGVGVTADTMERMQALVDAGVDAIVIDTAHGHSKFVIEKLKEAKSAVPVTVLLCVLFTLALGSIIFVFFAAYRNVAAGKDAREPSGDGSGQVESADTDEPTELSSPKEQFSIWQYLRSISIRDSEIIDELEVAPGQTTMLGISGVELSQSEADLYHIPAGILVCDISQRSTAYICGLRRTDIIQAFNGNRIYTMQDLIDEKAKYSVGQRITLTIFRDDDVLEFKFLLQPAP